MRVKNSLKRLTSLLLCLVMMAQMVVVASAADVDPATTTPEPTDSEYFTFNKTSGTITKYNGPSEVGIVIPAKIDGAEVKAVGSNAFGTAYATYVVLPSTITSLADCFSGWEKALYFYGDCPSGSSWTDSLDAYTTTFYCRSVNKSDFTGFYDYYDNEFEVEATIADSVTDPVYASDSHTLTYTDNGDGTHTAKCTDEGCDYTVTENHTFKLGVCVCGAKVNGSDPEAFIYKELDDGNASIIGYKGQGGEIILPSEYEDASGNKRIVTTVGDAAFSQNSTKSELASLAQITKITVPASIVNVERAAFSGVGRYGTKEWNLTEIVFEAKNVSFGRGALGSNPNLTSITLPAELTEIGDGMFSGDTALTALTLPATVTKIGENAFSGCTALTRVTFKSATPPEMAKSTTYPYGYPFAGLTQEVTLNVPEDYLSAYTTAWADMLNAGTTKAGNIAVVGKEDEVASIPDFKVYVNGTTADSEYPKYMEYKVIDFDNKTKTGTVELKYVGWNKDGGTLDIPETVTTQVLGKDWTFTVIGIGENAMFSYEMDYASSNYWFTTVNFPSTLQYIAKGGCWSLEKVTEIDLSGTQVKSIGSMAFYGCKKAETIKLPATLESMGGTVTGSSKEITAIPGKGETVGDSSDVKIDVKEDPETYTDNIFACCDALKEIIVDEANPNFKSDDGILYSKNGKKLIRYPNAKSGAHFDIPDGVEVIASQAFMQSYTGDSPLQTVKFPSTLKEIESLAFRQSNLTSVTLPVGVKFGSSVFDISKKLETVIIPEGVTELSDYMFWSCEALTEVTFPNTLEKVGANCFGHSGLTSVDLGSVKELGNYSFYYTKLNEVTIPATLEKAGIAAFCNISTLTKATFENGAKDVGNFMFFYDTALSDLTLADSITNVGEYAFGYCVALEKVTMPKSLSSMGDGVFYKAWKSLNTVVFPDEVTINALPASTFESCQALTYVYLGKNIKATGPVSLYDTNEALKVDCAVSKDIFERNIFDVFPYDLTDTSLFTKFEPTTDEQDGYPIYKAWLNPNAFTGSGGGCGGGSVKEGDYYLFVAGATPTFTYGSETPEEPAVLTLYVKEPGNDAVVKKTYTRSDLKALAETNEVVGYQYWQTDKNDSTKKNYKLLAAKEYVTIKDLLADAGVSFSRCDSITASASDGFGSTLTYADNSTYKYYIDGDNTTEVPAALLLNWNSGSGTLEEVAKTAYASSNIRFAYGISQEQYENQSAAGKRLASNVVSLTVNVQVHQDAGDPVKENFKAPTCTEAGTYEEVIYCTCTEHKEISRKTVEDETRPATGHTPGEAVVENKIEATCAAAGSYDEVVYCTVCNAEISREAKTIEVKLHTAAPAVVENVVPATCTAAGSHDVVVYCAVCEAEMGRKTVPDAALGHKWDNGVVTKAPTTTETGEMTYTCTVCKETKTEILPVVSEDDVTKADAVKTLIDGIDLDNISKASGQSIKAARAAYNALSPEQKNLVSADALAKLEQAEVAYAKVLINGIGNVDKSSGSDIDAAREAYDALSPEQKEQLKNEDSKLEETLTKAEAKYKELTSGGTTGGSTGGSKRPGSSATDKKQVKSGNTGDAGIALYMGLSLLSLTGGAWVAKKNRKVR